MLHRAILRFEHAAREGVLLVYLSAMALATATYFVGHSLGWGGSLLYYVALAEACAVEVHSFLSQRMTRSLHLDLHSEQVQKAPYAVRDVIERRYLLHLRITCGLVAFSVFNSIAFWATIMHPANLGDWLQVVLRGAVIPIFFLLAGFLTSVREDVSEVLNTAADALTRTMVRHATRQWTSRVRKARKRGANLAESVAQLIELQEAGSQPASVRIRLMDAAIRAAEAGHVVPVAPRGDASQALPDGVPTFAGYERGYTPPTAPRTPIPAAIGQPPLPPKPGPTGGTPAAAPVERDVREDGDENTAIAASASKRSRPGAKRPGVVRLPRAPKPPAEERIRAVWKVRPGASVRLIARRAGVSESTASKWRALLMQEDANASKHSPEREGQAAQ